MIKFIPVSAPVLTGNELKYVTNCIRTGWISSLGKYVTEFQKRFSNICGSSYGIATSNGTTALHLALATLGVGKGDEVIVPDLTFVATANAVSYTGARPVFVDAQDSTWNIAPDKIEGKITKRTKAIIVVHLYGHPCDMDSILKIAKKHKLYLIEDAAEAHGAEYKGQMVGGIADMGCFSFYGNKIITTGEGGMILTNNPNWHERACLLRDHGMSAQKRYYHSEIAYNYRITNIQAAIGLAQLERFRWILSRKDKISSLYDALLRGTRGITLQPKASWGRRVCWLYSILIEDDFGISRDALILRLKNKGIDTRPFFIPMHLLPIYRDNRSRFSVAEGLSRKGLSLPSSVTLKKTEVEYICGQIKRIGRQA